MTDKEIIEVIQAHIEGKQIQYYDNVRYEWLDCEDNNPCWNFYSTDYRVKPESNVRPYKDREECWNDMQKHEPLGWTIDKDNGSYVFSSVISSDLNFESILKSYTYLDGSPFGIVEEE